MHAEYRIEKLHGCIITYGSMPVRDMIELMEEVGDEGQMDTTLSRKLGASMVMGSKENLTSLAQDPSIQQQIKARIQSSTEGYSIPASAIRWLEEGERGLSSETIFVAMTGIPIIEPDDMSSPSDVSDFLRCRRLMEAVPEFAERREELKTLSRHWSVLIEHWDELCASVDEEAPAWREKNGSCKKTYARMKQLYTSLD